MKNKGQRMQLNPKTLGSIPSAKNKTEQQQAHMWTIITTLPQVTSMDGEKQPSQPQSYTLAATKPLPQVAIMSQEKQPATSGRRHECREDCHVPHCLLGSPD